MKDEYISTEHFLLALADGKTAAGDALRAAGRHEGRDPRGARRGARQPARHRCRIPRRSTRRSSATRRDLTRLAHQGKLDPVIGRDEEIRRTIQILSRAAPRTTPCSSARPASARPPSSRASRSASRSGDVPESLRDKRLLLARSRRADRRREVPRRVRGAPEGRAQGDRGRRGPRDPVHRRAAHARRRRRRRRRGRRGEPLEAGARRAASCAASARRRSTSTASTSRRTRRSSAGSSR